MIGYLEGNIIYKSGNNLIVDVNGVGYQVEVSELYSFPAKGEDIELFIYTYVREDQLNLYGFSTMEERELFKTLLSVSRIGPKAGINILSTLTYERFIRAIMNEKIEVLKEVSGIGTKTAQRLILELQNKIDDLAEEIQVSPVRKKTDEELYTALNNLGYSRKEIKSAVKNVQFREDAGVEEKIKTVLSYLGRDR